MRFFKSGDFGILVCLAFIIVLFCAALYTQNQSRSDPETHTNRQQSYGHEIEIKKERSFDEILSSDPTALYTERLFWATAILAIFTMALAAVTVLIWLDSKEVAARQQIAARRALMHAVRGARASEKAVETTNLASERQLRAYLLPRVVEIGGFANNRPAYRVVFRNFGQTPAYKTTMWAKCMVDTYPLDPAKAVDEPEEEIARESSGMAAPQDDIFSTAPIRIDRADLNEVEVGLRALYIFGGVYYSDVFGKRRKTKFCYYRNAASLIRGMADGSLTVYKDWNEAN